MSSAEDVAVRLRDGEAADLEAMYCLDRVCFEAPFRFSRAAMRMFTLARGAFSVVAEDATGGLAGFVVVQVNCRQGAVEAYIVTLDVSPEWRRQGVAARLMGAADRKAAEHEAGSMGLHVWTENEGAVRFYERAGYVQTQRHPGFYADGLDAFGYIKSMGAD